MVVINTYMYIPAGDSNKLHVYNKFIVPRTVMKVMVSLLTSLFREKITRTDQCKNATESRPVLRHFTLQF